jgi:hypothetical protein
MAESRPHGSRPTPEEAQAVSGLLSLQLKMFAGNGAEDSLPIGPGSGLPPPRVVRVMYGEPPKAEGEPDASPDSKGVC